MNNSVIELIKSFYKKKLSTDSAVIFLGIKGIGKATLAQSISSHILEEGDATKYNGSQKFARHLSNIYQLKMHEDSAEISVNDIRDIKKFIQKKSTNLYKFIIIHEADKMNISSMNALLKIIEEPTKMTHFILVSNSLGKLSQTILSRCFIIKFKPLSKNNILSLCNLKDNTEDIQEDFLYDLSGGSYNAFIKMNILWKEGFIPDVIRVLNKNSSNNINEFINIHKSYMKRLIKIEDVIYFWLQFIPTLIIWKIQNKSHNFKNIGILELENHSISKFIYLENNLRSILLSYNKTMTQNNYIYILGYIWNFLFRNKK